VILRELIEKPAEIAASIPNHPSPATFDMGCFARRTKLTDAKTLKWFN
jgi:hypothetical protein